MILRRLLQALFHLLYNQFAWTYDWVAAVVSAGQWIRWVQCMVPRLAGAERILEIGHGPGHLLLALEKAGAHPVGVDLSAAMGRRARRMLLGAGLEPELVRADAVHLPFPAAYFDAVVLTFPADYIAEVQTWNAFRRVLQLEGRILVLLGALPAGNHPLRVLSRLLFRVTGQLRLEDVQRARSRFVEYFDDLGLDGQLSIESDAGSDLFLVEVRHAREDPDPAV